MSKSNKPWGQITSGFVDDIPPKMRGTWADPIDELNLRLEQCAPRETLIVPFGDLKKADAAKNAVKKMFNGKIIVESRKSGDAAMLYIYRKDGVK